MPGTPNDEPVYKDQLDHFALVKDVGDMVRHCKPPYVIGVCGAWGSGKTSFLRKLWAYLGGPFEDDEGPAKQNEKRQHDLCLEWFGRDCKKPPSPKHKNGWHVIWFNPWQHQFEETPLVALLHEIRQHFSLIRKAIDQTGKMMDVTTHSLFSALDDLGKALGIPLPKVNAKGITERGREYEAEHFLTVLSSQRFRDFFEKAIAQVIGSEGRMVIFIDDLDRCEGGVAYRLLESLKLYLNARNCIYVLGLDQGHLEETIARVLSGSEETRRYRPLARDYLSKMFQNLFLLPVPKSIEKYAREILDINDEVFENRLKNRFGLAATEWPDQIVKALDTNLPHNPRKVKSFIASWKLYTKQLESRQPEGALDWRLSLILNYLGQFEEPLFRQVEEAPGFYTDKVVSFCKGVTRSHPLFDGLELPYRTQEATGETTGGLASPTTSAQPQTTPTGADDSDDAKRLPSRIFWIGTLVNKLGDVDHNIIQQHLLSAKVPIAIPPARDKDNASEKS